MKAPKLSVWAMLTVNWSGRGRFKLGMLILMVVVLAGGAGANGAAVLDYADLREAEPNVVGGDLDAFLDLEGVLAIGIEGSLDDSNDVYKLTVDEGGYIELKLQAVTELVQTVTALAVGTDDRAYFAAGNDILRQGAAGSQEAIEEPLATASELAAAAGIDVDDVAVSDIAVVPEPNGAVLVALGGTGYVLRVDWNVDGVDPCVTVEVDPGEITAVTGFGTADLVGIEIAPGGEIYLVDQVSGSVLEVREGGGPTVFTDRGVLGAAVRREFLAEIEERKVALPSTVLAQEDAAKDFSAGSLILGGGDYPGAFYLTQFGEPLPGDGSITRIEPNGIDPCTFDFVVFFDPNSNTVLFRDSDDPNNFRDVGDPNNPDPNGMNPSALALDLSGGGVFGNKMYLGTFGAGLGDLQDGKIFVVDADSGNLEEFVTAFLDSNGQVVRMDTVAVIDANTDLQAVDPNGDLIFKDDVPVTGFFDIIDMAFGPGGGSGFGSDLYVLSENADLNGEEEGGFSSDLWRVDPCGVARLFVPDIGNAVISLAFGPSSFGGDLYVGTWQSAGASEFWGPGRIIRVHGDGTVDAEPFVQLKEGYSCSDIVFSSADSEWGEALVLNLKDDRSRNLVAVIDPGGNDQIWAGDGLNVGDVSSGDMVFDGDDNLIMVQGASNNLLRLDYQELFSHRIDELRIGVDTSGISPVYSPYVMVTMADRQLVMQLDDTGDAGDTIAVVAPSLLGTTEEDEDAVSTFAFDGDGSVYIYSVNDEELRSGPRDDGVFPALGTVVDKVSIEKGANLLDVEVSRLTWASDGSLLALGKSRLSDPNGRGADEPNGVVLDEAVVWLGNTESGSFEPNVLVELGEIPQITLAVTGPDDFEQELTVTSGLVGEAILTPLAGGEYVLTLAAVGDGAETIDYDLVVSTAPLEAWTVITKKTGPVSFDLLGDDGEVESDRMVVNYRGRGRAELLAGRRPGSGVVVELLTLKIVDSTGGSRVEVSDAGGVRELVLDEIVLGGRLKRLVFPGRVDRIVGADGTNGVIRKVDVGRIRAVDAGEYAFFDFRADAIGDPNSERISNTFEVSHLARLTVGEDIDNVNFLPDNNSNRYFRINVGGVIRGSTFNGFKMYRLLVENKLGETIAIGDTEVRMGVNRKGSMLNQVLVREGDVDGSAFWARDRIKVFEIDNGNLVFSWLIVRGPGGRIDRVRVRRADANDLDKGNIRDDSILSVGHKIADVYVAGEIDEGTSIETGTGFFSGLGRLVCGGDFAGSIVAGRVRNVMVGFDERRKSLRETAKADFTGSITATWGIGRLNVTGAVSDATISVHTPAGINFPVNLGTILAEDGLNNVTISVGGKIGNIVVGYINGNRRKLVNPEAGVSGSIEAKRLGHVYYTGELTAELPEIVSGEHDDIP